MKMEKCNPDWQSSPYLDGFDTNDIVEFGKWCEKNSNIEKSDFEKEKFSLNYLIKNVNSYSEVNSLLSVQSENYTDNKNRNISKQQQQQQEVDFTVNGTSYLVSSDMYTHSISEIIGTSEQEPMNISHNSSSGTKFVEIASPQRGITGKRISGSGADNSTTILSSSISGGTDFSTAILSSSISGGKNEIVPSPVFNFPSVPTVSGNMSPCNSSITSSVDGNGYSIQAQQVSDDTSTSKSLVLSSINNDENKVTEVEQIKMKLKRSRNNESSKRTRRKKKRCYEEMGEENRMLKEQVKESRELKEQVKELQGKIISLDKDVSTQREEIFALQKVKDDLVIGIAFILKNMTN